MGQEGKAQTSSSQQAERLIVESPKVTGETVWFDAFVNACTAGMGPVRVTVVSPDEGEWGEMEQEPVSGGKMGQVWAMLPHIGAGTHNGSQLMSSAGMNDKGHVKTPPKENTHRFVSVGLMCDS